MNITTLEKPFCVIGRCSSIDPMVTRSANRTWFADQDQAASHAVELMRRSDNVNKGLVELYVVSATLIVRTPVDYEIVRIVQK